MSDALKACPFCGKETFDVPGDSYIVQTRFVVCEICGARGPVVRCADSFERAQPESAKNAIAAWNRRVVTPEQVEAAVDALCENDYDCARMSRFDLIQYLMRAAGFEVEG